MLKRCNEAPVIKKYSKQCLAGPLRVLTMQGSLSDAEQTVALKYLYSAAQCETGALWDEGNIPLLC